MSDSAGYSTLNGYDGVGFSMAWINCDSAISFAYVEEVLVMLKLWG